MVGAVIVKDGNMIGQGYHEKYGEWHAERNALAACTGNPAGATLYVTLEPCCHHGKTPPCTDAILKSGIQRVVIGSKDPNPLVCGKGSEILRAHGIEVTEVFCGRNVTAQPGFFPLYPDKNALSDHEIRHDPGWQKSYSIMACPGGLQAKRRWNGCIETATETLPLW
jgi:pyrimidine deaminase RibD-like protein